MKHLVLGSAGQIGAYLVAYLKRQGEDVIEFDIENDWEQDLRLRDHPALGDAIRECDFVYFLAFDVGGCKYLDKYQNTYGFIKNNDLIMLNVFEQLEQYQKPFIFASTQMVQWSESPYATLKTLGECYTRSLNGLIVKLWNIYGVEKDPNKFHVLTDLINMARAGEIRLISDGTEAKQFLHCDDCARALVTLANKYAEIPRNINLHISSFEWISIDLLAMFVAEEFNNVPVIKNTINRQTPRFNPDPWILSIWQPEIDLKTGIRNVVQNT